MQVLIVDTDNRSAEFLRGKLSEITDSEILCISKPSEAIFDVEEGLIHPNVCFIDLIPANSSEQGCSDSADTEGIELARILRKMLPGLQIVFTSEYDSFYLQVYEVDHVWFLRKPIDGQLLHRAWERTMERLSVWVQHSFTFRFNRRVHQVPLRDILYFEKHLRKVILHTTEGNCHFYGTMDDLMMKLDHRFLRCHNSYVVNLDRIDTWTKTSFTIAGHKIPISRQYAKAVEAVFLDAMGD